MILNMFLEAKKLASNINFIFIHLLYLQKDKTPLNQVIIMKKEIKFSLVYRDMWQSSGKYQPRADQLAKIAPLIVEMGCFARVETNGGAFEQVNLLYGENPNKAVRTFTKPLREAGIQTHMLDRGLNALRMYPVPADVRRLMYKVKHAQGVDITRIFCGLNEVRNIIPSIKYAKEAGMIPQATLCITYSPVHTVDYYSYIADQLIEAGAPEICLKDMAGIGRPEMLGQLVRNIKDKHPEVIVQYHGYLHAGLHQFGQSLSKEKKQWRDATDEDIQHLSETIASRLAPKVRYGALHADGASRYTEKALNETFRRSLTALRKWSQKSSFDTKALEKEFYLHLSGEKDTFTLNGKIDHVARNDAVSAQEFNLAESVVGLRRVVWFY